MQPKTDERKVDVEYLQLYGLVNKEATEKLENHIVLDNKKWESFWYKSVKPKFLCNNEHAIKRTCGAITLDFFIFIYHIYVQLKSGTGFVNDMTLANKYTNRQIGY